jgi:DNA polymerase III delta prime subunit
MANRKEIEERILHIISYIDQNKMLTPLVWSIKLFSLEELLQLKEFLEKWDYKPIYLLLDSKIKEYLNVIEEIKQIKIWEKLKKVKEKEKEEIQQEQLDIDALLA